VRQACLAEGGWEEGNHKHKKLFFPQPQTLTARITFGIFTPKILSQSNLICLYPSLPSKGSSIQKSQRSLSKTVTNPKLHLARVEREISHAMKLPGFESQFCHISTRIPLFLQAQVLGICLASHVFEGTERERECINL
jgi:hypothetical protein